MLRIGVLSDTHLSSPTPELKEIMGRVFGGVDVLLHAGDMTGRAVYDYLCSWDLRAVRGNMDDYELAGLVPARRIESIGGRRIGVVHGSGSPFTIRELVAREFSDVDVIVYGHSHVPALDRAGTTVLFNPGAMRNPAYGAKTVGMIEIVEDGSMAFRHIEV